MKIAVSVGDLNGIGIEIALKSHDIVKTLCHPRYVIDPKMLKQAADRLEIDIPNDFETVALNKSFTLTPAQITKESGAYSYASFEKACDLADAKVVDAVVTLPIHKLAWHKAGIPFSGHTDMLADRYKKEAIMLIGAPELFTALYTHHIPLKVVPSQIHQTHLASFLCDLYKAIKEPHIAVLGLNPHAGDGGILGDEEKIISRAIEEANRKLKATIFIGPLVPDTAFTPHMREQFRYFVCMYHDQGLIPAKALYFEEGINISLNLPIIRTSVDHGTAFDIAYQNEKNPSTKSYINAVKEAVKLAQKQSRYLI